MQQLKYGDNAINLIAEASLEKWKNTNGDFLIHIEHPELSALCPRSGYPDNGMVIVDYIPGDWIVELKAFKLYINSFRNQRISHEDITNEVASRLNSDIQPKSMRVIGDFMRRGGIKTVITVHKGSKYKFDYYHHGVL